MKKRHRSMSLVTGAIVVLLSVVCSATSAVASETPGSYVDYSFPVGTISLSDVTFSTTVTTDPGPAANVFWANQFNFTGASQGAYAGMQADGAGAERMFLFSVWGASEYKLGTSGSHCLTTGEGPTKSCRISHAWVAGHTYELKIANEGGQWFGATVTDTTASVSFKIGSIRALGTSISVNGMSMFTEYFEWNNSTASCMNQPFSRADIGLPLGNKGTVTASISGTHTSSTCSTYTKVTKSSTKTTHTNAIGNSVRGEIIGSGSKRLDVQGGLKSGNPTALAEASGSESQAWVLGADKTIRSADQGLCIEASGHAGTNGTTVDAYTCNGGANQQWAPQNGTLINVESNRCLDIPGGNTTNGTALVIWDCNGGTNQKWTTPHPPAQPKPDRSTHQRSGRDCLDNIGIGLV